MNVALYMVFTLFCFYVARPPLLLADYFNGSRLINHLPSPLRHVVSIQRMSKEQTIAVCFCGAAKTTSLGIPLVTAMWARADNLTRAYIQIPVLLYTIEQVFMAQILVYFFKWYLRRGKEPPPSTEVAQGGQRQEGRDTGEQRDPGGLLSDLDELGGIAKATADGDVHRV